MQNRFMRAATAAYLVFFAIAVTWPGVLVFNRVTPIILGLPFNLFCIALLIVTSMAVLFALYVSEDNIQKRQGR